jgi:translation initiation factor IF-2
MTAERQRFGKTIRRSDPPTRSRLQPAAWLPSGPQLPGLTPTRAPTPPGPATPRPARLPPPPGTWPGRPTPGPAGPARAPGPLPHGQTRAPLGPCGPTPASARLAPGPAQLAGAAPLRTPGRLPGVGRALGPPAPIPTPPRPATGEAGTPRPHFLPPEFRGAGDRTGDATATRLPRRTAVGPRPRHRRPPWAGDRGPGSSPELPARRDRPPRRGPGSTRGRSGGPSPGRSGGVPSSG